MKRLNLILLLTLLMSMIGAKAYSHDIEVENADGVTIYYNYINNGAELAVTYRGSSYGDYSDRYNGAIVIPEEVSYLNKTQKVTSLGDYAFCGCSSLTSVTIGNNVTTLGERAFYDCYDLVSVMIGNSVTTIGDYDFSGCSALTSIIIPNSVTTIGNGVFSRCSSLTSVTIGNSVTTIGDYAFENCSGLTSVTIPNSMTTIGHGAFYGCSGMTSVTIPNNVTSIGKRAFYGCSGLTSVTIGNSVTSIEHEAFSGCDDVAIIISYAAIPPICESNTFEYIDKLQCTLQVPAASINSYKTADQWKEFYNIEATGIKDVKSEPIMHNHYFTLGGHKQEGMPMQKGIYIVNGKKFIENRP